MNTGKTQHFLLGILLLAASLYALHAQTYTIGWSKIAGGGGTCVNGPYTFNGTVGQPDASGTATQGQYAFTGGFWAFDAVQPSLSFALGTITRLEGPAAGVDSVVLAVINPADNFWTATANASWLHLSAASQTGTGSTNVVFTYDANPGTTRNGTLTIAGLTLTVTQAGSTYVQVSGLTTLVSSNAPSPASLAVDNSGNVYYIANADAVFEWMPANNTVTEVLGGSGLTGVAVDGSDNIYFDNQGGHQADEYDPSVGITTIPIPNPPTPPYFPDPVCVAVGSTGNVYIGDDSIPCVYKWTTGTTNVTRLPPLGNYPIGLAVDAAGNVYEAENGGGPGILFEWMPANSTVSEISGISNPYCVAVDAAGNVYATANTGSPWAIMEVLGSDLPNNYENPIKLASGLLNNPQGLAVDAAGDIYVADTGNNAIKELPYAFVDPTPKVENASAGNDVLPVVLPAMENLLAPFAPTSSQPWLTIAGVSGGVVSFNFTANTSVSNRTAYITLLGQTISVTQAQASVLTLKLINPMVTANGVFQFGFSNSTAGGTFTVLTSTNISVPLSEWTVLGTALNIAPNLYRFTDTHATNAHRFYTVRTQGQMPTCVTPPVSLAYWWPGDGNALDIVGGNNGTLQGGVTFTAGEVGQAFNLDGSSGFISTSMIITNPQTFTLSLWFRTSSTHGGVLISFDSSQMSVADGSEFDRNIYMDNAGAIHFGVWNSGPQQINSAAGYNDNNWHWVTGTLSAGTGLSLYLDGLLVGNNPAVTSASEQYDGYWRIGEDNLNNWPYQPSSYYFQGQIDEVAIFNTALSSNAVSAIYAAGSAGMCQP